MPRTADPWMPAVFAGLCLAWGSGWMALKIGVAALPPLLFASSRFLAAVVVLLGLLAGLGRARGVWALPWRAALPGALLMVAVNYGLMAWGVMRVASGLAAVVNLTTVPLAMAVCGSAYGLAAFTRRTAAGVALGSCGLALLLLPPALAHGMAGAGAGTATGIAAIAAGAACYAWGSILTRRRVAQAPALELATLQALAGGGVLLIASAAAEPWVGVATAFAEPVRLGGWAFLVAITVGSTPAYLMLLARWAPARVAAYAYVCPVIALAEGSLFGGEALSGPQAAGAAVLGLSAWLVLGACGPVTTSADPAPVPPPQTLPPPVQPSRAVHPSP